MAHHVACTVCGTPIEGEGDRSWPKWMRKFRAVYTKDGRNEHWDPDVPAHLSGVGRRGDYADLAPTGHSSGAKRSRTATVNIELMVSHILGPGLAIPGLQPVARGFPLHDSCWRILVMVSPGGRVNIQRLLDVLRSFPIHRGIISFGHDYGGIAQYRRLCESGLVAAGEERRLVRGSDLMYPRCDPLDLPALRGFLNRQGSGYNDGRGPSATSPYDRPAKADVFCKVPEEILSLIFEHLPSHDVASLRKSSRVCATATLRDSFWRSRFQPGREFDYILGPDQYPEGVAGRWNQLYHFARDVQDTPDVANRRRVWGLARSLQRLVAIASRASLHGDEVPPVDWRHWITACRSLWSLDSSFTTGSRALRTRTLGVPPTARVFVSFVEVYGTSYLSGLRLECESASGKESSRLGYIHSETLVSKDAVEISGFLLAHGERGIRGMAVLSATGFISPWVGDYENIPKRRLVLGHVGTTEGTIHYLKGGFDALKLVSLSISNEDRRKDEGTPTPPLRDSVSWYPDIPDPNCSILGIDLTSRDDDHPQRPVTLAIFSGSNGDRLSKVSGVSARFNSVGGEGREILGLTVSFTDGPETIGLAVDTGEPKKTRSSVDDDSTGESDGSDQGTDWVEEAGNDEDDENDYEGYEGDDGFEEEYEDDYEGDEVNYDFEEEEKELTLDIDSRNGERIVGIDVLRRSEYGPKVIKIRTNRERSAEFPPPTVDESRGSYFSVKPFQSDKGVVVGFCSRVSSLRGLTDIGIVVTNNLRMLPDVGQLVSYSLAVLP